jgi:hypothetical protein
VGHIARRGLALLGAMALVPAALAPVAAESPSPGPPLATDDSYATAEDTALMVAAPGVLSDDAAPPSSCVAIVDASALAGQATLNPDGSFQFTPQPNFHGDTAFSYGLMVTGAIGCPGPFDSLAAVHLTVDAVNDPPTAIADSFQALKSTTLNIGAPGILANDADVDGDLLTAVKVSNPVHGVVVLAADGSFSYTPTAGYVGADAFSYRASDGTATSAARVVSIQISAVPSPSPSPSPTSSPSPTPEPTPTPAPSSSPIPAPTLDESTPAATFALATAVPTPSPTPPSVVSPAAHTGGLSLPVLLVLVLLGMLLLFGAVYAVPRWINSQRGVDEGLDDAGDGP